jgi:quinol monooxygenase YgiN
MKWADGMALARRMKHAQDSRVAPIAASPLPLRRIALYHADDKLRGEIMRLAFQLLLGMALMPAAFVQGAQAEGAAAPIFIATYLEVGASSAKNGAALLTRYRDAARKEDGNMRAELAQEIGRPNRFVVLETWKDLAAFEAHGKSAGTTALRDKFKAIQAGPYDERVHNSLNVGPNDPLSAKRAVIVVSHVDVPPPRKDECIAALNPLADASRKDNGNQRFEVQQQTNRPNHFTVVEAWKDKKAYDTSRSADAQRQFRDKLGPMLGALYDERLYRVVE